MVLSPPPFSFVYCAASFLRSGAVPQTVRNCRVPSNRPRHLTNFPANISMMNAQILQIFPSESSVSGYLSILSIFPSVAHGSQPQHTMPVHLVARTLSRQPCASKSLKISRFLDRITGNRPILCNDLLLVLAHSCSHSLPFKSSCLLARSAQYSLTFGLWFSEVYLFTASFCL